MQFVQLTEKATDAASKFIDTFYKLYDEKRLMLQSLYKPSSAIVWNGNVYQGSQALASLMTRIPSTKHEIHSVDSQPLLQTGQIVVVVSGTVQYGGGEICPKFFLQQFLLTEEAEHPGNYFISSDCLRFV